MPLSSFHPDADRLQKRWILGALGIAVAFHAGVAGFFGWYQIPGMETPLNHSAPTGPFTLKRIEIRPDALKADQPDPIAKLPVAEPPKNPADFNLDPSAVERALQTPQPTLSAPAVPEPSKVIAATDLSQGLPLVESDSAKVSAEILKPTATSSGPLTSAKLAQDIISSTSGTAQIGGPTATAASGADRGGSLPGFSDLAPGFKTSGPTLSNLPEPILLRLPSDVLFDFDSAQLKPEAGDLLGKATGLIAKYPQADIQVDGYSDSYGRADYNQALSQQRAEAVQAWLQDHAPSGTYKYKSKGHGSANFVVATTGSIQQQQANRRVEIVIQALNPQ